MESAIELSARFKIPVSAVEGLAEQWGIDLAPLGFVPDAAFNRAAYDLKRGNVTANASAYQLRNLFADTDEANAKNDMLDALMPDKGISLSQMFGTLHWQSVKTHHLPGAQLLLDQAAAGKPDKAALETLGAWARSCLDQSEGERNYHFLAVRLLLSLPEAVAPDYPQAVQSAINRLKHYGYLDGYFRMETNAKGKRKTIFHKPLDL